nr:pyrroline-5-carboxylate reductase [uncultured Dethiosulfovibrio sp.]
MVLNKVSVIGAGALGGAVVEGLVRAGVSVWVYDTNPRRLESMSQLGANELSEIEQGLSGFDVVFWALKPHLILPIIGENRDKLRGSLCCSLAACVDLELLSKAAPGARWARAMTNICASVCRAFTGYALSSDISERDKGILSCCFDSIGLSQTMAEQDLDGITGVAGSGPAYVFTILESFIQGGLASGLSAEVSLSAAAMTLIGSSELVLKGGDHPGAYKDRVCTPAGTTIDALRVLEAGGLRTSIIDGVVKATEKSRQVGEALREKLSSNPSDKD